MRTVANVLASGNGIQLALGGEAAGAGTVTVGQSQGLDLAHAEEHVGLSAGLGSLMVHDSSETSDLSAKSAKCARTNNTFLVLVQGFSYGAEGSGGIGRANGGQGNGNGGEESGNLHVGG